MGITGMDPSMWIDMDVVLCIAIVAWSDLCEVHGFVGQSLAMKVSIPVMLKILSYNMTSKGKGRIETKP